LPGLRLSFLLIMQVRLLFFAHYRELAGASETLVELPEGATARDLVCRVRAGGAALARIPAEPVVAVNQEYVRLERPLAAGDEVALLPPVAGG
jgi:molybdopterin converting factor subunit 1